MRQYRPAIILAAIAIASAFVCWFIPSQRELAGPLALICSVIAALTSLLAWPEAVAFTGRRSPLLATAGWALCVVGLVAGFALSVVASLRSWGGTDLFIYGCLGLSLLGFIAARLPSMVKEMAKSRAGAAAHQVTNKALPKFDWLREGLAAPLSVFRSGRAFLQIAGPWAAFLSLSTYVAVIVGKDTGPGASSARLWLLGVLLLLLVAIYLILPTIAVAWFRWTVDEQLPRQFLALPDRAALAFAWRIWIGLGLVGGLDRLVTPKLTQVVSSAIPAAMTGVGAWAGPAVDIALVMLASSFTLQFPAIAVNDAAFTRTTAMIQGRKLWPGLPVGLLLSLAPFPILAWACEHVYGIGNPAVPITHSGAVTFGLSDGTALFVALMALFATLASGATFLSRAYLAAKAR